MEKISLNKIAAIHKATLRSLTDENNASIIKNFAETAIRVLGADFGIAWGKFSGDSQYKLIFKSSGAPKNILQLKDKAKNSVTIPVRYGDHVHGNIMLVYKKPHHLTREKIVLKEIISGIVAQAVTINWLVENEQRALALAEKQKATEVLLGQEKLKTEFISNATHEFRTPLAIMRGNVELALHNKTSSKESLRSSLKEVGKEIIHLSDLITDLALLTNPNIQEKETLDFQPIILEEFLRNIIERLGILIARKKIDLKLSIKPKNLCISGDAKYLDKVFLNLIRNAITYGGDKGKIKIEAKRSKNKVVIKVVDNGVGIATKDLPRLFERFFRTEKARQMSSIGTGLGLSIVKQITEVHGGTVSVSSIEGKGTTFVVTLPMAKK